MRPKGGWSELPEQEIVIRLDRYPARHFGILVALLSLASGQAL